jgi:hypothetical protein
MSRKAAYALLSAMAAPAISLFTLVLIAAVPADAAAACNAAPKSPAGEGRHWYYRTDRASGRKCWYLAPEGQKVHAAPRIVTRTGSKPAAPPVMDAPERRLTRPAGLSLTEPLAPPAQVADAAVSPAVPAAQAPDRPISVAQFREEPASVPATRARPKDEVFRALEERQLPASEGNAANISAASPINTLQLVLIALAAICLLASAALSLAAARRRRTQIEIVDLGAKVPLRMPATVSATARRHAPERDAQVDEERLRQFARAWKQAPSMWPREPALDLTKGAHRFADNGLSHAGA